MSKLMKMLGAPKPTGEPFVQAPRELALCLLATLVLAGIMMVVYRLCHDSLTYRPKFNVLLPMLSLASALLLTLIQNNPMFSLGALGALSICRIRLNTRDPRDLGFVFWSLLIGISSALGAFAVGAAGTLVLSAVMLLLGRPARKKDGVTVVVRGEPHGLSQAQQVFRHLKGSTIQSEIVYPDSFELVYWVQMPQEQEQELLQTFRLMEGINGVHVLAPQTQVV